MEYKHINHFEYLSGNHSTRGRLDPRILQREYDEPVPYRPQREAKADWLAGMLLPPRVALLAIVQRAMLSQAPTRGVRMSEEMLGMGLDRTGANIQMRRRIA